MWLNMSMRHKTFESRTKVEDEIFFLSRSYFFIKNLKPTWDISISLKFDANYFLPLSHQELSFVEQQQSFLFKGQWKPFCIIHPISPQELKKILRSTRKIIVYVNIWCEAIAHAFFAILNVEGKNGTKLRMMDGNTNRLFQHFFFYSCPFFSPLP